MLKDMKAVLTYFMLDYRYSILVFWSILAATLIGFMFVTMLIKGVSIIVFTGPITIIFSIICGLNMTKETFPFCVKMGITRTQYVIGAGIFMALLSLVMSVIHFGVKSIFVSVLKLTSFEGISHYSILQFLSLSETWINELWVLLLFNFLFLSFGSLIGTIFYKYGLIGGFISVALLLFALILPITRDFYHGFFQLSNGQLTISFFAVVLFSLILLIPNWAFLRNASTIAARAR